MMKIWLLSLFTAILAGADVSGKWSGSIEVPDPGSGTTISTPVRAEFAQRDSTVSGRIGRREDEGAEPIRNGKVDGKKVTFEVSSIEMTSAMKFNLTLEGDRLEGEMKGSVDSGQIVGKVQFKRDKVHANATQ